jgi:hypothetical protein
MPSSGAAWLTPLHGEAGRMVPAMPVQDRAADTWEPLVIVADLAGGQWPALARAGGTVAFNILTLGSGSLLKLGKAGSLAAKPGEAGDAAGRAAKLANALGKTGRLVGPMTYVGKGAGFAKLKIGDMMAGLKDLHSGAADNFLHGTDSSKLPQTHAPVTISDKSVRYPDGSIPHEDGTMVSPGILRLAGRMLPESISRLAKCTPAT